MMAVSFAFLASPKGRGKECGKRKFVAHICQFAREKSRKTEAVFLGASRGLRGEIRNPPGLVFFLPLFLLEKQKKKWDRSRKSVEGLQPCN